MSGLSLFLLQTGSPLQARLEVNIFAVILIVVAIIFVIAVVYAISRAISKYLNSPAYLEKKKNRPTSQKDINEISTLCTLVKEEKDMLTQICSVHRTPNIMYLARDYYMLNEVLKETFKTLDSAGNESGKTNLFGLRKKLFKVYKQKDVIKHSKLISVNTIFTFTVEKGFHYKLPLVENNIDGLILNVPPLLKNEDLPKPLEKINFIFELEDGTPYNLETRVVRYQKGKENETQMIVVHSDKVATLQKREQERVELNLPCVFHSVKVATDGKGKKEKLQYIPSEKSYEGTLEDISTGGCRLVSTLPIKADQYIYIEGPFNAKQTDTAVGTIVRTTKRSDGIFILHIRFLKIDTKVVNRINAMVSKYDE